MRKEQKKRRGIKGKIKKVVHNNKGREKLIRKERNVIFMVCGNSTFLFSLDKGRRPAYFLTSGRQAGRLWRARPSKHPANGIT